MFLMRDSIRASKAYSQTTIQPPACAPLDPARDIGLDSAPTRVRHHRASALRRRRVATRASRPYKRTFESNKEYEMRKQRLPSTHLPITPGPARVLRRVELAHARGGDEQSSPRDTTLATYISWDILRAPQPAD
jgi:hypothetical protein